MGMGGGRGEGQSANTSLVNIAKQAGMNPVLLRRLFHSLVDEKGTRNARQLKSLGIALVNLVGCQRPLLANVDERSIIDVFASNEELVSFLVKLAESAQAAHVSCVVRDIDFDVSDLLTTAELRRLWPSLRQTAIGSHSFVREVVKLMVGMCEPLFKSTAEGEHRSPKSARNLFVRRERDLKRSASRRLERWGNNSESKLLFQAYGLKEHFLKIWLDDRTLSGWQDWTKEARAVPELGFHDLVPLIESVWNEVIPYFHDVNIFMYESWLDDVQKYEVQGTHSFAAARLALLEKYGVSRKSNNASSEP